MFPILVLNIIWKFALLINKKSKQSPFASKSLYNIKLLHVYDVLTVDMGFLLSQEVEL